MPDFPPLFDGRAVAGDPFEAAIAAACDGCDAGLILYRPPAETVEAALVLAPEVPLAEAAAMLLVAGNGLADALGALGPPEIAIRFRWPGGLDVEGARCGQLRAAAADCPDDSIPGWLVVGLDVPVEGGGTGESGERPDETCLRTEGIDVAADDLLGAWARHTLSWIARWEDEGMSPVHRDWTGRSAALGAEVIVPTPHGERRGVFQGLDERGGMLLKGERGVELVPLTEMLERRRC